MTAAVRISGSPGAVDSAVGSKKTVPTPTSRVERSRQIWSMAVAGP
jgi:hypothetical protein